LCFIGRRTAPHSGLAPAEKPVDGFFLDDPFVGDVPTPFGRTPTSVMRDLLDQPTCLIDSNGQSHWVDIRLQVLKFLYRVTAITPFGARQSAVRIIQKAKWL
jgi:hypothetical protein